jgi:outer membrane scaffolding protein for murein synthesis (MipA/OmpV family)
MTTSWSPDIAGRGGGQILDFGVSREEALSDRTRWSLGFGLRAADTRYQRLHFGVSAEQAALSQLPLYQPSSGWVHASAGTSLRFEINPDWVSFAGMSVTQPLGAQRQSPLVSGLTRWSIQAGIARRF